MSEIGTIVSVICVCAIASSIIRVVVPQGNTTKLLNTVIGVFILCCMIVPVKNFITNFNANITITEPNGDLSSLSLDAYNQAVIIETQNTLQNTLVSYLASENIQTQEVSVTLDSTDEGGIYIDSISIYISNQDSSHTQRIIELTEQKFQITPSIILR